jgi:uncharacterized protein YecE (DUF72 family)
MKDGEKAQLGLFSTEGPAGAREDRRLAEQLEGEHAASEALAARLPREVRFGTSSWSFPGWKGLVWPRRTTTAVLAREGLIEYSKHPLLRTVGIDRGFYAPIPGADLARYGEQLPPGFPCCAKAPEAVMAAVRTNPRGEPERRANPDFLSAERFVDEMVGPFLEVFRDHTGPFILQMPPAPRELAPTPSAFAEKLDRFLSELPKSARYAVELRDPELVTPEYVRALSARGASHVYNYVTAMPMPEEQEKAVPLETAPFAVVRLLLAPSTRYNDRREEFSPFDKLVAPDTEMRRQVVTLARRGASLGRDVFVLVNNKAEGCSPLTIRALAEMLAEESSRDTGFSGSAG